MTGGIEAIGSVVEGGMLARAVEPTAGEAADSGPIAGAGGQTHEGACLNCGTALIGSHCHTCGQAAHVHRTMNAFFHDLAHGVLHLDGKIWRTLPLLAWRPGRLTREYIDGRRASYVSPIALFLFVVFLTFAGFHAMGSSINLGDSVTMDGKKTSIADAESQLRADIAAAENRRAAARASHKPVEALDGQLEGLRSALATTEAIRNNDLKGLTKQVSPTTHVSTKLPSNWVDATWRRAKANPELLIYKLESDAYKYSWLLIPISVPFVWLLFPFSRRFHLYDHTVFVTYSLSFMMLVLLVASAGAKWGITPLVVVPVLYAPFHLYRQVRETYGTSRVGAIARTWVLLWLAAIAFTLWALAILGLILGG
jgi:hypothetical protein